MKSLYIDTSNSGISGDMFLSGLLSLLEDPRDILEKLQNLKEYLPDISIFEVKLVQVKRSGVNVAQLDQKIEESKHGRTSKMLLKALNQFLVDFSFSKEAINYANRVLNSLVEAEATVHGDLAEQIHLHELGSIDTLLDILGTTMALEKLGYFNDKIVISTSKLPLGGGSVKAAHGILPVPTPATLQILEKSNLNSILGPIESEIVTPTGIALLNALNPEIQKDEIHVQKVVQSTGQKKFTEFPNILRIYYGEVESKQPLEKSSLFDEYVEEIAIIETNVDDVSGELIGNLVSILEKKKVLDIQVIPSLTKKRRPSSIIKVFCEPKMKSQIVEILINELGTLGVRFQFVKRVCVKRHLKQKEIYVKNEKYMVTFKISYYKSAQSYQIVNIKPEFKDLKLISKKSGIPVKIVEMHAQEELMSLYKEFYDEKEKEK